MSVKRQNGEANGGSFIQWYSEMFANFFRKVIFFQTFRSPTTLR